MTHRIKTISNDIPGSVKAGSRPHAHNTASSDSRQSNKILELEWEALGKKLNKQMDGGDELVSLQKQVRDKDEQLKYAERKIAELKRQLSALQDKQRGSSPASNAQHRPNVQNKPQPQNKPAQTHGGNRPPQKNTSQRPMRPPQKFQGQGRK